MCTCVCLFLVCVYICVSLSPIIGQPSFGLRVSGFRLSLSVSLSKYVYTYIYVHTLVCVRECAQGVCVPWLVGFVRV